MLSTKSTASLDVIGNNAKITVAGLSNLPAKIDTGADGSVVWASQIRINPRGQLEFVLLAPEHPLYTGEKIVLDDYSVRQVRSSNGMTAVRYQVTLPTVIKGRKIRAVFTLADRSRNRFPVLIGRKTIQNKFLVDVAKVSVPRPSTFDNAALQAELRANPQEFHRKYMGGAQ